MKPKINFKNIMFYLQGNIRYKLFYTQFNFLIPLYIREQIKIRIFSMNQECFNNGTCVQCGCKTTELQMANKKCDGNCYPRMLNKTEWINLNKRKLIVVDGFLWKLTKGQFKRFGSE